MEEGNNKEGLREYHCIWNNAEAGLGEKGDKADAQWNSPLISVFSLRKQRADPQNAGWCYGKTLLGQNFLEPMSSDSFKKKGEGRCFLQVQWLKFHTFLVWKF